MNLFRLISLESFIKFLFDFILLWVIVYGTIALFRKNERAGQILKGLLVIILARYLASWIGLKMVSRLLAEFMNWGVLSLVIIFAPEIRNTLENVGKKAIFTKTTKLRSSEKDQLIHEICVAAEGFSKSYTGALISIEMNDSLKTFFSGGVALDGIVSATLLESIFYPKSALHDGAAIIQGNRISNAAVFYLPTTKNVLTHYGARHRAALGISEQSDCITIIVSEETGDISIARFGELFKVSVPQLEKYLADELLVDETNLKHKKSNLALDFIEKAPDILKTSKFEKEEELENGEKVKIYYLPNGGRRNEK